MAKKTFINTNPYVSVTIELDGYEQLVGPGERVRGEESILRHYRQLKCVESSKKPPDVELADSKPESKSFPKPTYTPPYLSCLETFLDIPNTGLTIIILNLNGHNLITRCIQGIEEHVTHRPLEVIIGDTGTTDQRVLDFYKSLDTDVYRVVYDLDYHFAKNNNALADQAKYDFLLFLNSDVFLQDDVVSSMMKYAACFKTGAVGCRLLYPNGRINHDGIVMLRQGKIIDPGHFNHFKKPSACKSSTIQVAGVTGACMLTRKPLFQRVGGFCEEYQDVYQDCDYNLQLRALGFDLLVVRDQHATHIGNATRGGDTLALLRRDLHLFHTRWESRVRELGEPPKPVFSAVTAVMDKEMFMAVAKQLEEGNVELNPVLNKDNIMTVPDALNHGAQFCRGDYILFCHQDVVFPGGWSGELHKALQACSRLGVAGFAGRTKQGKSSWARDLKPEGREAVSTLDEYVLIRKSGDGLQFDPELSLHYYGPDICLQANQAGYTNYVVGVRVEHLGDGRKNLYAHPEIMEADAKYLWRKWHEKYPKILTTTTEFRKGMIKFMLCREVMSDISMP